MSLKVLVKTAAAEALCRTRADRLLRGRPDPDGGPLVLGYHQVVEDCGRRAASIPAMLVSTRTLERQLDYVGRHFRFVSLDELGQHLESGRPPGGRPLAAVTFDDGYRDVYEHAFPLLERKGIPAAVFVVTDLVGTARLQRHDRVHLAVAGALAGAGGGNHLVRILADLGLQRPGLEAADGRSGVFAAVRALIETLSAPELERVLEAIGDLGAAEYADHPELLPLTWEMVAEMSGAGITIGSHTRSHHLLTQESREHARQQLRSSREVLESRLGAPVRHFAYPDGSFNGAVVEEVAAAGYRYAYTTCRHRDRRHRLLTIPRRMLWENASRGRTGQFSTAVMQCEVRGVFDFANRCRQDHGHPERAGWAESA